MPDDDVLKSEDIPGDQDLRDRQRRAKERNKDKIEKNKKRTLEALAVAVKEMQEKQKKENESAKAVEKLRNAARAAPKDSKTEDGGAKSLAKDIPNVTKDDMIADDKRVSSKERKRLRNESREKFRRGGRKPR